MLRPIAVTGPSSATTGRRTVRDRDPGIPLSLLPPGWNGVDAGKLFGALDAALGSPARDHAPRVIRATAR